VEIFFIYNFVPIYAEIFFIFNFAPIYAEIFFIFNLEFITLVFYDLSR